MPSSWIQPIFIYTLIYDIATYVILSSIFIILFNLKIITLEKLILSLIFLLTPFFFNGFLFHWTLFPDQSKFLSLAYEIRNEPSILISDKFINNYNLFSPAENRLKLILPSILYAFSPIISLETYLGISLFNRALFLFTWIFLTNKKFLDNYNSFVFLVAPSLILYSSIALRDSLVIILMLFFLYFFTNKNYFKAFIISLLIFFLRMPTIIILIIFLFLNLIFQKEKINFKLLILICLIIFPLIYFFLDSIIFNINKFRLGFFNEQFGQYQAINNNVEYEEFYLDFNFSSVTLILKSFFNFVFPPLLKGKTNMFNLIYLLEAFLIYSYLYLRITKQKKINRLILIKWILVLLFSYLFFSVIVFNDGSIHRYKVEIIFFVIFGYFNNIRNKV